MILLRKFLTFIKNLVTCLVIFITVLFSLVFLLLYGVYVKNLNEDNFVNRNKLTDIEAVENFLQARFPVDAEVLVADIIDFVEEQKMRCFIPTANDRVIRLENYKGELDSDSGTILCGTDITNPEFYGVHWLPDKLAATAWDVISVNTYRVYINFNIHEGKLDEMWADFSANYL